jgi:hypothetical protein
MPSADCNRTLVYVGCLLEALGGLTIMGFASAAINQDPPIDKVWWMVEGGQAYLVTMVVIAICLIFLSLVGIFGAKSRDKATLLCFYLLAFVFITVRLVYTSVIFETFQPNQLDAFVPIFKQEWIKMVSTSKQSSDSIDSKRAVAFVSYVQSQGKCCGFDDASADEQNIPSLNCTSTETCKATFLLEFRSAIEKQCIIIFIFATVEAVTLLLMCGFTCRKKEAPAFSKVKNGVGSVRRV